MDATIQPQPNKPIDRWLGLGGIAVGVVFYLLPKTRPVVVWSLAFIFVLLIHPVWNFWWIERRIWSKLTAAVLLILALVYLGLSSWPPAVAGTPKTSSSVTVSLPTSVEPTVQQMAFIVNLQNKYADSVVTVRSIQLDSGGKPLGYVDGTGFFVDGKGLILTTAENLRLPKENCSRKFEVIASDGTVRTTREIGLTTSEYWRLLKVNSTSNPLPMSHEPFRPGQTVIILGKNAHSGAIESRLGKIDHDQDPFFLPTETPSGFNGGPIFDDRGKVVGVQIFRPETGKPGTLMCLKVPIKKFLVGTAAHRQRTPSRIGRDR